MALSGTVLRIRTKPVSLVEIAHWSVFGGRHDAPPKTQGPSLGRVLADMGEHGSLNGPSDDAATQKRCIDLCGIGS